MKSCVCPSTESERFQIKSSVWNLTYSQSHCRHWKLQSKYIKKQVLLSVRTNGVTLLIGIQGAGEGSFQENCRGHRGEQLGPQWKSILTFVSSGYLKDSAPPEC